MDGKKKNKRIKNYIGIILGLIAIAIAVGFFIINSKEPKQKEEPKLLMSIADTSKNCFPNWVKIYSNREYTVTGGTGRHIGDGKLAYFKDLNLLVEIVKRYKSVDNYYRNYLIILADGSEIRTPIKDAKELNEMLDTIPIENIFWCD